ncbi:IPT/TIG domain-containing protein [Spirosoma sp. KUDC1026]|nr:IPT/TIG domain-containing protein [Spirosoma sp. KUDC1026]
MNRLKNWKYVLPIFAGFMILLQACKKDPDPVPAVPTITSINPTTAPIGSTIAISGTNFSATPSSNTVTVGGAVATIVSASSTQLVIVVPATAATTGVVSVSTATGQTAQSSVSFTVSNKPVAEKQGTIRANTVWSKDTTYVLRGFVYVATNYTLTIQPGTVIRGAGPERDPEGLGRAGTLIVERVGKLIANGTASEPIVFTSSKAAGQRNYGDWGGIILIGKSPINRPGATSYLGGIRGTTETYNEPEDNSGTLRYVRIEFAGVSVANSTNGQTSGLTMYGVGNGTIIDNVQVSYSRNHSFGWYGGSVNTKHLVALRGTTNDFNTDWGYYGKVQFGVGLRDPEVAGPAGAVANGIYSQNFDPGENAVGVPLTSQNGAPKTAPVFTNMSIFVTSGTPSTATTSRGGGSFQAGLHLTRNTAISVYNSLFYGFPEGLRLEGTTTGTLANVNGGTIDLKGVTLANSLTPIVGGGAVTTDIATTYFNNTTRSNQIVPSSAVASLLLNSSTFNLTAPSFLLQASSPLLTGAVTGGKVADSFFTQTAYRGAFGTENWLQGWTNFDPQNANYDR